MGKFFKIIFIRALLLSLLLLGFYYAYQYIITDKPSSDTPRQPVTSNITSFPLVTDSNIITTSIALVTKVSQRFTIATTEANGQKIRTPGYIAPQEVPLKLDDIRKEREEYLSKNLLLLKEYKIVLKTDIKKALDNSTDRQKTLETIIEELQYRYTNATNNKKNLANYASMISTKANEINNEVEKEKARLTKYFQNYDDTGTLETVDRYLVKKNLYQNYYTDITLLTQILKSYSSYNEYNKKLLDTLINNKDAIIKESYVVYPDTGSDLLKDFNLIYTEEQYKQTDMKKFYDNN